MIDLIKRSTNWVLILMAVLEFTGHWLTDLAEFITSQSQGSPQVTNVATAIVSFVGLLARNRDKWLTPLVALLSGTKS